MYSPQMTPRLTDESLKTVATLKGAERIDDQRHGADLRRRLEALKAIAEFAKADTGQGGIERDGSRQAQGGSPER